MTDKSTASATDSRAVETIEADVFIAGDGAAGVAAARYSNTANWCSPFREAPFWATEKENHIMTSNERPTVVISCRVMQELLTPRLPADMPVTFLDILLHNTPRKLAAALQAELDKIEQPSNVIIGYGLCGNGLVGVRADRHTLIVPRTHDCVAIFLGSHQRYVQRFFANPNTYYLTRGWLEAHDDPLHDYLDYVKDYDEETADYLVEVKYHHYRRLCMVGFSQDELDLCRPMAKKVADFCGQRWGMTYEEIIGSTGLLDALLSMPERLDSGNSEFVVVQPGETIEAEMFMRSGEAVPAACARKGA